MKLIAKLLIVIVTACVIGGCGLFYEKSDKRTSELAAIIPFQDDDAGTYAMEARYSNWPTPDTLIIYIDGVRHLVLSNGDVVTQDDRKIFSLENEYPIAQLFFAQRDRDMIVFFTDVDVNGASSFVKRINVDTGQVIWSTETEGFSFSKPLLRGQFAYVGTIGFIGKMKLKNGHFDWKYSNLGQKGRFSQFHDVDFPTSHQVRFIAPHPFSFKSDTVIVSDITGEIVRMN